MPMGDSNLNGHKVEHVFQHISFTEKALCVFIHNVYGNSRQGRIEGPIWPRNYKIQNGKTQSFWV